MVFLEIFPHVSASQGLHSLGNLRAMRSDPKLIEGRENPNQSFTMLFLIAESIQIYYIIVQSVWWTPMGLD